jgi:hypothetical protein
VGTKSQILSYRDLLEPYMIIGTSFGQAKSSLVIIQTCSS